MKVYVVVGNYDYEPSTILGVFDSKKLAIAFADSIDNFDFLSMEELTLNNTILKNWKK